MTASFLESALEKRKAQGRLRRLQSKGPLIDLTSNDYFGFAKEEGAGSSGSRLLTGNHPLFEKLEHKIACFHKAESCLIYNSGYCANLGLISALSVSDATFFYDLEIHASAIDGMRLGSAKKWPFRHNDLASLEKRLKSGISPCFVLTESIFSLSGDFAPLKEIASLCQAYGAHLIVDEAHATGICGPYGEGLVVELGLEANVFARVHTFSKALGAQGAAVVGSSKLKEFLINFSRPLIYSTALPPSALVQIEARYDKLQKEGALHQKNLRKLIAYYQKRIGSPISPSPIQPLIVKGGEEARKQSQILQSKGLDVRAILPPTVPSGKECLRIVLHSFNTEAQIDALMETVS
jgi:8-amino-7-oxononanoate synthase